MAIIDKVELLAQLRARIDADLVAIESSQAESQAAATHEEARPESDKDTRATETSYLARGLAARVAALREAAGMLANLALRRFADDAATALTALVTVEDADGSVERYFIAPAGGGTKLEISGVVVAVVTPESPLARALLGKRIDDEIDWRGRALSIIDIQ